MRDREADLKKQYNITNNLCSVSIEKQQVDMRNGFKINCEFKKLISIDHKNQHQSNVRNKYM